MNYYTTLKGAMEKEDPDNWEFVIPAKLKQLYQSKDFGRYAMPNGEMPICFIVNTDNTGGNSGSPVFNAKGELIGTGFDRNYEGLTGDIASAPLHSVQLRRHSLHFIYHREVCRCLTYYQGADNCGINKRKYKNITRILK